MNCRKTETNRYVGSDGSRRLRSTSKSFTRVLSENMAKVELDDQIVLDAMILGVITYEEVDVDEDELTGRRRSSKKRRKTSFLLIILFLSFLLYRF